MCDKKNVYMVQPNYLYGKTAHIPYAVGTIVAYAMSRPDVTEKFAFKEIIFLREDINSLVERMEKPFLVGFSTYLWNFEYNKALARKVKEKFPDCVTVFGGHHISNGGEMLVEYDFIDVLCHGEGEEVFSKLLLALDKGESLDTVPNISYRDNGEIKETYKEVYTSCDYPSPYLSGCFDKIMEEHPDFEYIFLFESNRGCMFNCAYCDWGHLRSKLRCFPEERVKAEFRWMCDKKIDFCGCADANFGILERDAGFIDTLIELKKETGYPKKFQASYAKNNTDRIFEISRKLSENSMNKGVTLAFQTLSDDALEYVGRKNISVDSYRELLCRYNAEKIPTYTELILGLPGETYDSFASGIDSLMSAGQHHAIYIHDCEWLPGSAMGSKEYMEKYKIRPSKILLNQPHMESPKNDGIREYSHIVTSTCSMSSADWVRMNIFSYTVQCFHHMGLLEFFAIYLHNEKGIPYRSFYEQFIEFMLSNTDTVCGSTFSYIKKRLEEILEDIGSLVMWDERFGDVEWPFEEYAYLNIVYEAEKFYNEVAAFLKTFDIREDIFSQLLDYQRNMIKIPFKKDFELNQDYDFPSYFKASFSGEKENLKNVSCNLKMKDENVIESWQEYARYFVWYGRKDNKNFYDGEITVTYKE